MLPSFKGLNRYRTPWTREVIRNPEIMTIVSLILLERKGNWRRELFAMEEE